jgi:hypothetical protein
VLTDITVSFVKKPLYFAKSPVVWPKYRCRMQVCVTKYPSQAVLKRKDKLIDGKQRMSEGFPSFSVMCPQPDTVQFWPCWTSALVRCCTLPGQEDNRGQEKKEQGHAGFER